MYPQLGGLSVQRKNHARGFQAQGNRQLTLLKTSNNSVAYNRVTVTSDMYPLSLYQVVKFSSKVLQSCRWSIVDILLAARSWCDVLQNTTKLLCLTFLIVKWKCILIWSCSKHFHSLLSSLKPKLIDAGLKLNMAWSKDANLKKFKVSWRPSILPDCWRIKFGPNHQDTMQIFFNYLIFIMSAQIFVNLSEGPGDLTHVNKRLIAGRASLERELA